MRAPPAASSLQLGRPRALHVQWDVYSLVWAKRCVLLARLASISRPQAARLARNARVASSSTQQGLLVASHVTSGVVLARSITVVVSQLPVPANLAAPVRSNLPRRALAVALALQANLA